MKNLSQYITEQQNRKEFIIIKPEFLDYRNEIVEYLKERKIIILLELRKTLSLSEAKKLYKVHSKEDFYEELCKYMSSGDSIGILLINYGNQDMLKLKDEIRDKYGKDDMKNCIHSSDSPLDVYRESKIYFATPKI